MEKDARILSEEDDSTTPEDLISLYEDLHNYQEICLWDTDFALLDQFDEDTLTHSESRKALGLGERKDTKIINYEVGKARVRMEMNVAPWEEEWNQGERLQ